MPEANLDLGYALKLPPAEAVAYFRAKRIAVTDDWRELWQEAHTRAFTVAKMAKHDLLEKTREVLRRKLAEGLTERQAAAALEAEFRKAGWWGKRAEDGARLGSPRRIKTILRTNTLTAYAAGRHQRQIANASNRPWWRYVAILDGVTRLEHRQLHNKILRFDDPAWDAIYPPNGFNCRCRVIAMTDKQAEAAGADAKLKGDTPQTREADMVSRRTGEIFRRPVTHVRLTDATGTERWFTPDAGWGYKPGAYHAPGSPPTDWKALGFDSFQERLRRQVGLPKPPADARQAAAPDAKLDILLNAIGVSNRRPSRRRNTPVGPVILDAESVAHTVAKAKDPRERFVYRILPTLDFPDEVWRYFKNGELRNRYIKLWDDEKATLAIVEVTGDGRVLFNFMPYKSAIDNQREGWLLYKRPEEEGGE